MLAMVGAVDAQALRDFAVSTRPSSHCRSAYLRLDRIIIRSCNNAELYILRLAQYERVEASNAI